MFTFHATIHARPAGDWPTEPVELGGQSYAALKIEPERVAAATFDCSFEEAVAKLSALPRMFVEPDGSLVWVSSQGQPAWQVDGNLYDRGTRLLFVDVKGTCPGAEFDQLLLALGWPATPVVFQLVRQAVTMDEAEWRRFAERPS